MCSGDLFGKTQTKKSPNNKSALASDLSELEREYILK